MFEFTHSVDQQVGSERPCLVQNRLRFGDFYTHSSWPPSALPAEPLQPTAFRLPLHREVGVVSAKFNNSPFYREF